MGENMEEVNSITEQPTIVKRRGRRPSLINQDQVRNGNLRASPLRVESPRKEDVVDGIRKEGVRRKKRSEALNEFDVPKEWIPEGYVVQWNRFSVFGQEDTDHMIEMQDVGGWTPATTDMGRLGNLVPKGSTKKTIIKKGLILCIRPKELEDEARAEDLHDARSQLGEKLASIGMTPQGSMPRKVDTFNRSFDGIPVDE